MNGTSLQTSKRVASLDLLRILACCFVIFIHVCSNSWKEIAVDTPGWQTMNVFDNLAHCAVPLFLMISGYFFLSKDQPIKLSVLFKKYILHLFVVFCVWDFLYAVDSAGLHSLVSFDGWKDIIIHCLKLKYHLWFLTKMIAAYLLLPLLWIIAHHENGKYVKYFCIIWLLFYISVNTVFLLPIPEVAVKFARRFVLELGSFPGYMLLGYYLASNPLKKVKNIWWIGGFILITICMSAYNSYFSLKAGKAQDDVMSTSMLPTCIQAICLFAVFYRMKDSAFLNKHEKALTSLSACTLGIYLLHPFVLEHISDWLHISVHELPIPAILSVPAISLGTFAVCTLVIMLIRRIPILSKWII